MRKSLNKGPGAIVIEGHVQGLANTRALGENGIPVIVVDTGSCIAGYSKYCEKHFTCPPYIEDAFIDFLIDLCGKENLQDWMLLPSNDHAVYNISRNREKLGRYFKIITPSLEIIDRIYNKENLLKIALSLGIPIPVTFFDPQVVPDSPQKTGYPLITRGKFGLSFYKKTRNKAYISKDKEQFTAHLQDIINKQAIDIAFSQEVIPFDGTNLTESFTAFCIDGEIKTYWMGSKLRDHPFRFGTATLSKTIHNEQLLAYSKLIVNELNYTGVCEIEFLKDPRDQELKLIEINARTWLWVGLAVADGINYPVYIYNFLNGIETDYPSEYPVGLKWINHWTDLFFSVKYILEKRLTIAEYKSSLKGTKIDAIFSRKDILPSVMMTLFLPYMLFKR